MSRFWKYFSAEGRRERHEDALKVDDEVKKIRDKTEFEKNDSLAIIIAALTTLLPYALIGLAIFIGLIWIILL